MFGTNLRNNFIINRKNNWKLKKHNRLSASGELAGQLQCCIHNIGSTIVIIEVIPGISDHEIVSISTALLQYLTVNPL